MNIPDQFFGLKTVLQIRIRGFFPVVRIETPPPPHPQPSVFSPPLVQGGYTVPSLRARGWGVPIPKRGQTLWYSRYLLRYICTLCSPAWGRDTNHTIHRQYAYTGTVCVRGCVKILVQNFFCQFLILIRIQDSDPESNPGFESGSETRSVSETNFRPDPDPKPDPKLGSATLFKNT
jgi:hypothetical protein